MKVYHDIPELTGTAVALGCFDGVHRGHQAVVAAAEGDGLCRTVFSFADGGGMKHGAPQLLSFEEKCRVMRGLDVAHLLVPSFESVKNMPPEVFFEQILCGRLGARRIVCGENFRFGKGASGSAQTMTSLCREAGIECKIVPPVLYGGEGISSSRIRAALSDGSVEKANAMLGRLYGYQWEVVHGRQLGRTLGTPTINQYFPDGFLIPRYGVYASITEWDGRNYPSVTNVGVKPTVGSPRPLSETWMTDFSGDLYGQQVRVSLVAFMRDECRFDSVEELKQAILRDGEMAKALTAEVIGKGERKE